MHILFLTDNFPPETNAPASRTHEHAKLWVAAGHRLTVLTCAPNFPGGKVFPGYRNRLWQRETMDGIEVIRIWTYITANEGTLKRSLDYLSFGVALVFAGLLVGRPHVIVGTSPQFFTAVGGYVLSRLRRLPFVMELRDLWPDSIAAVGAMRESLLIRLLRRLEYFLYHHVEHIVAVTHSFKRILTGNGVAEAKISVVTNGVDLDGFVPGGKPPALLAKWSLEGKFVAAYIGTIGLAHGLGTLLETASRLRWRTDIVFLLVGGGAEQQMLVDRCREMGLQNVVFAGPVSKTEVKDYWRLADAALVLLRDTPLFAHVIPSKMFEAMGMERPIILGVRGEAQGILESAQAGIAIEPESVAELEAAVTRLADNPELAVSLGRAGRLFAASHYNRARNALSMLSILAGQARPGS